MSSMGGFQGCPRISSYVATKAFNYVLAEGLWKELKPRGIDVLGSCPGAISTPNYKDMEKVKAAPGTLTPEVVAEKTLKALGKGPIVVPGALNKFVRFVFTRLLTRRAAVDAMTKSTGGLS